MGRGLINAVTFDRTDDCTLFGFEGRMFSSFCGRAKHRDEKYIVSLSYFEEQPKSPGTVFPNE